MILKAQFVDWSQNTSPPQLEPEIFATYTRYDALNRPIQIVAPNSSRAGTKINAIQPLYNEANLLEQIYGWLQQNVEPSRLLELNSATHHFVNDIDYVQKVSVSILKAEWKMETAFGLSTNTMKKHFVLYIWRQKGRKVVAPRRNCCRTYTIPMIQ